MLNCQKSLIKDISIDNTLNQYKELKFEIEDKSKLEENNKNSIENKIFEIMLEDGSIY